MTTYPSKLVERAVEQFSTLPGIGRKTALRLALHLLSRPLADTELFTSALFAMRRDIVYCERCHNISDMAICSICANPTRDSRIICVVQHVGDVIAIENTGQYKGLYHVLGGVISPIDGIGPQDLTIEPLIKRCLEGEVDEVILALGTTMEGDTTNFFIHRSLQGISIKISTLARGVAIGDEIEYADEITLGRSILSRTDFEQTIKF